MIKTITIKQDIQITSDAEKEYNTILDEALNYLINSNKGNRKRIEANFELGKMLSEKLAEGKYGDGIVKILAYDLSKKMQYKVYPMRLYECIKVSQHFETINYIWDLEKKVGVEITWTFLIKLCSRKDPKTDPSQNNTPVDSTKTVSHEEIEHEFISNHIVLIEGLKRVIDCDEITCSVIPIEDRKIHLLDKKTFEIGQILECVVVVSESTHSQIHEGVFKENEIQQVINKRNADFAEKFILSNSQKIS